MNFGIPEKTDILIAGGGIAGYKAACAARERGLEVLLVTKNAVAASDYVLGFNAALSPDDSPELFASDTLKGGAYINNPSLVETLAREASHQVRATEAMGLEFDKTADGYDLMKPLGCTVARLAHVGNRTGKFSLDKLKETAEKIGVKVIGDAMLADVCVSDGRICGAVIYDLKNKQSAAVRTKAVVIATGGIHMTGDSTYPACMTGDGYAVAYRAGASLVDMEFLQFEPCRCIYPKKLGISTTLLAKGGKITNSRGERFLLASYNSEGDIPKDALAKLIYAEVQKGNGSPHGGVYLDLTDIPREEITERHSLYYHRFLDAGIDITREVIEVGPCPHSFMGGIQADSLCRTAVDGLFAAGEAIGGIHGANRVGGNAGTEIYVFGNIAGESAADYAQKTEFAEYLPPQEEKQPYSEDAGYFDDIKKQIHKIMSEYMGPVRDAYGLTTAEELLDELYGQIAGVGCTSFEAEVVKMECENMLTVCKCSVNAAIWRRESRGVHFRSDYPEMNDNEYRKSFVHKK